MRARTVDRIGDDRPDHRHDERHGKAGDHEREPGDEDDAAHAFGKRADCRRVALQELGEREDHRVADHRDDDAGGRAPPERTQPGPHHDGPPEQPPGQEYAEEKRGPGDQPILVAQVPADLEMQHIGRRQRRNREDQPR
ncbi:hypothetical protein XM25_15025 [Devosia sp. H5989]|nr:hypothetical protein XM25_15025 [Devosia sp. H5989]